MTMKPLQMWVVMSLQDHTGNSSHILHNLLNLFSNIFIILNWYYHFCCCCCNCDERNWFLESSSLISKGQHCILKNMKLQLVLGYSQWVFLCMGCSLARAFLFTAKRHNMAIQRLDHYAIWSVFLSVSTILQSDFGQRLLNGNAMVGIRFYWQQSTLWQLLFLVYLRMSCKTSAMYLGKGALQYHFCGLCPCTKYLFTGL